MESLGEAVGEQGVNHQVFIGTGIEQAGAVAAARLVDASAVVLDVTGGGI